MKGAFSMPEKANRSQDSNVIKKGDGSIKEYVRKIQDLGTEYDNLLTRKKLLYAEQIDASKKMLDAFIQASTQKFHFVFQPSPFINMVFPEDITVVSNELRFSRRYIRKLTLDFYGSKYTMEIFYSTAGSLFGKQILYKKTFLYTSLFSSVYYPTGVKFYTSLSKMPIEARIRIPMDVFTEFFYSVLDSVTETSLSFVTEYEEFPSVESGLSGFVPEDMISKLVEQPSSEKSFAEDNVFMYTLTCCKKNTSCLYTVHCQKGFEFTIELPTPILLCLYSLTRENKLHDVYSPAINFVVPSTPDVTFEELKPFILEHI